MSNCLLNGWTRSQDLAPGSHFRQIGEIVVMCKLLQGFEVAERRRKREGDAEAGEDDDDVEVVYVNE
jgi:hypothetical protein